MTTVCASVDAGANDRNTRKAQANRDVDVALINFFILNSFERRLDPQVVVNNREEGDTIVKKGTHIQKSCVRVHAASEDPFENGFNDVALDTICERSKSKCFSLAKTPSGNVH